MDARDEGPASLGVVAAAVREGVVTLGTGRGGVMDRFPLPPEAAPAPREP